MKEIKDSVPRKNKFANRIVIIVLVVEVVITGVVLYTYLKFNSVIPSSVISSLSAFWGGELLLVALRQIFGSDIVSKSNKKDYSNSSYYYSDYNDIDRI